MNNSHLVVYKSDTFLLVYYFLNRIGANNTVINTHTNIYIYVRVRVRACVCVLLPVPVSEIQLPVFTMFCSMHSTFIVIYDL
jgi:hypothetical protein